MRWSKQNKFAQRNHDRMYKWDAREDNFNVRICKFLWDMHCLVQSLSLLLWIETNSSAQQTNGFWSFSSCLSKKIRVHLYTHALRIRIRFCPGNRSSYETDTQNKLRSKDTIATAAMQNIDRYFREGSFDAVSKMYVWTFQISFYSAVCHFRWTPPQTQS